MQYRIPISSGVAQTKTFPLGDGGRYRRVTLSLTPGSVDNSTASQNYAVYYAELKPGSTIPSRALPQTIDHISTIRYYTVEPADNNGLVYDFDAQLDIYYNDDDVVDTPSELRLVKSLDESNWLDIGGVGSGVSGAISSDVFHSFSDFVLGSSTANNPLPVRLLTFEASASLGQGVSLFWQTASEKHNDYFAVERAAADNQPFTEILRTPGAGDSDRLLTYQEVDRHPLPGRNLYRLKQVDRDGTVAYSKIVSVVHGIDPAPDFQVSPNPVAHQGTKIKITGLYRREAAVLYLVNSQGVSLRHDAVKADEQGTLLIELRDLKGLPAGIYSLVFAGEQHQLVKKLMVR